MGQLLNAHRPPILLNCLVQYDSEKKKLCMDRLLIEDSWKNQLVELLKTPDRKCPISSLILPYLHHYTHKVPNHFL